ncbi:unnamed protein product [Allacma fusca]|uniref:Uncharacterized protein n=1 Tax=Allacma fusca TaxID=39272 RepID=A0A8J2Q0P1_9HEXA|nr:unnamed protein product [Allacma fusca]
MMSTSASSKLMLKLWKRFKEYDNHVAYGFYINMNAISDYFLSLTKSLSKHFGHGGIFNMGIVRSDEEQHGSGNKFRNKGTSINDVMLKKGDLWTQCLRH